MMLSFSRKRKSVLPELRNIRRKKNRRARARQMKVFYICTIDT